MLKAFTPLSKLERTERLLAYREFLSVRDGVPNMERRELSHRETAMQRT